MEKSLKQIADRAVPGVGCIRGPLLLLLEYFTICIYLFCWVNNEGLVSFFTISIFLFQSKCINSFNKCLLSNCYQPDTVLGVFLLKEHTIWWGRLTRKQHNVRRCITPRVMGLSICQESQGTTRKGFTEKILLTLSLEKWGGVCQLD